MKQKGSSNVKGPLWNHLDKKVLLWHCLWQPLFLRVYSIKVPVAYMFFQAKVRKKTKHARPCDRKKNTVSVQGFPPEIYIILIFYLEALSTKNNVATIIKTFSS